MEMFSLSFGVVVVSWELSISVFFQVKDKNSLHPIPGLPVRPSSPLLSYPDSDGLVPNKVLHFFLIFSGKVLDIGSFDSLYLKVFSSGSVSSYGNLEISVC